MLLPGHTAQDDTAVALSPLVMTSSTQLPRLTYQRYLVRGTYGVIASREPGQKRSYTLHHHASLTITPRRNKVLGVQLTLEFHAWKREDSQRSGSS